MANPGSSNSRPCNAFRTDGTSISITPKDCPGIKISFLRTIRVMTGKEPSLLPGDLGHFLLYDSDVLRSGPKKLHTAADFIFSMYGKNTSSSDPWEASAETTR